MSLFEKLRKRKNQPVEQPKPIKQDSFTAKLGIPFGLNEIEYISIINQDLDEPMYYLVVSNRERLKILPKTRTNSKDEIVAKLEEMKTNFKAYGNFVNLGEGLPLINLPRVNYVELIWDEHDENDNRVNHCDIRISNGQVFHTEPRISDSRDINYNEWLFYTFSSSRNDHLYGK